MTPIFIHIRHTTIYDYSITVYNCVILHTIFNLDTLTYVLPVSDGDPMYVCINFVNLISRSCFDMTCSMCKKCGGIVLCIFGYQNGALYKFVCIFQSLDICQFV